MLATFEAPTETVGPFGISDDHLRLTVPEIKQKINDWLYDSMNGVVQSGPFVGMKLAQDKVWNDDSLGAQILGCYEQELHRYIEAEIARLDRLSHPKIVDIGCAGGYYAVGMACRVPRSSVWILDSNKRAECVAIEAGYANGRVLVSDRTLTETMADVDCVICDCEGAELLYLDPVRFPDLVKATIIVECHDYDDQKTTQTLVDRFRTTHCGIEVLTGSRNPTSFSFLRVWHQTTQWLAVDEGRPGTMRWLVMRPVDRIGEYS